MSTKDHALTIRNIGQFVNENDSTAAQILHDVRVVNNLFAYVKGLVIVELQCDLDNVDGTNDACTESPGARQDYLLDHWASC